MQCPIAFPHNCSIVPGAHPKWAQSKGPPCVPNLDECAIPPGSGFGRKLKRRYPSRGARRPYTKYCVRGGGGDPCLRARRILRRRQRRRGAPVWVEILPVIVPEPVRTPEDAARIRQLRQHIEDLQRQLRARPGDIRAQAALGEAQRKLKECNDANAILMDEEKIQAHELRLRAREINELEQRVRALTQQAQARPEDTMLRTELDDLEEKRDRLVVELEGATGNRRRLENDLAQMTHSRDGLRLDLVQCREESRRVSTTETDKYKGDLRARMQEIAVLERKVELRERDLADQARLLERCITAHMECAQKQAEFKTNQAILETRISRADETATNLRQEIDRLRAGSIQTEAQQSAIQAVRTALQQCQAGTERLEQAQALALEQKDAELRSLEGRIRASVSEQQATLDELQRGCNAELDRLRGERHMLNQMLQQAGREGINLSEQQEQLKKEMDDIRGDYAKAWNDLLECQERRNEAENALDGANVELELCRQERLQGRSQTELSRDAQERVNEEKGELEKELANTKADFDRARGQIISLQAQIGQLQESVTGMSTDIESLEAEVERLKQDKARSAEHIEQLQRDGAGHVADIRGVVEARQGVDARLQKCENELEVAQGIHDRATDAMNQAQKDRDGFKLQLDQLKTSWGECKQQYDTLGQDRDAANSQVRRLERELRALRDNLDQQAAGLKADIAAKQKTISDLALQFKQCSDEQQKAQTRISGFTQALAETEQKLASSEEEKTGTQARFDRAQVGLNRQLSQTRAERDECRAALKSCQASLRKRRAEPEPGLGPEPGPPLRRRRVEPAPRPEPRPEPGPAPEMDLEEPDDDLKHDITRCPADYPYNCAAHGSQQAHWSQRSAACVPTLGDCNKTFEVVKLGPSRRPWTKGCKRDGTGEICP